MIQKTTSLLLVIFLILVLGGFQCRQEYIEPPKQYFKEKVDLAPAQKIYNVYDTIWLRYTTSSKTFLDTVTGQRLSTNTIKFKFGASLQPKYQAPFNPQDGFCSFILPPNVTAQYGTSQSGTATFFNIDCDNTSFYNIRLGIVVKYRGIYILNLPDNILLEACAGQTNPYPSASVQFSYNLADPNKDIYLSIPSAERQELPVGYTESRIDLKVAYALQVQ